MLPVRRAEPGGLQPDDQVPGAVPAVLAALLPDPQVGAVGLGLQHQPLAVLQGVPRQSAPRARGPGQGRRPGREPLRCRNAHQRGHLPQPRRAREGYLLHQSCR